MQCPEFSIVLFSDKPIDFISVLGADEGRGAHIHDKQDHSRRKQVSLETGIFALLHLWWLISFGAQLRIQDTISIVALPHGRQPEVRHLQTVILVEEDVLGLEVAMGHPHGVQVLDRADEHLDQAAADFGWEFTLLGNVVE